jgi:hypothetical protein
MGGAPSSYHPTVNYESGILPSCVSVKQKNQENRACHPPTGEQGLAKDSLLKFGGAIGVGLEVDFSLKKFWDAHLRNLACIAKLAAEGNW